MNNGDTTNLIPAREQLKAKRVKRSMTKLMAYSFSLSL